MVMVLDRKNAWIPGSQLWDTWPSPAGTGNDLAIEPMVNIGTYDVAIIPNKWTVVTKDGSLSAHFEHSVLVTGGSRSTARLKGLGMVDE